MSRRHFLSAAVCLLLVGCRSSPAPKPAQKTTAPTSTDAVAACARATATARTDQRVGVGSPTAPTVASLSFHTYPYSDGYPNKMIIYAVAEQRGVIKLRGSRCTDNRPLRFWYGKGTLPDPPPPFTEQQLANMGDATEVLMPVAAGLGHTGYVLYSSTGRWQITLSDDTDTELGVLVVEVV